jgi:hypothetical protein
MPHPQLTIVQLSFYWLVFIHAPTMNWHNTDITGLFGPGSVLPSVFPSLASPRWQQNLVTLLTFTIKMSSTSRRMTPQQIVMIDSFPESGSRSFEKAEVDARILR